MNEAIDMVRPDVIRNPKNGSELVPRVDFGRCCWCSLCTDVCPAKSLTLSSEYSLVSNDPEDFLYAIPDAGKKENEK